jgi:acyl-CoA synthetase (NDP forming)
MKVGKMVEEEGIVEMDLNPVFVYDKGYCVVDARMVVGEQRGRGEERSGISYTAKDVKDVLNPESIAVVGASTNPIKVGNSVLRSLIANKGIRVYPINPSADEIHGLKSYTSLKALPEVPDVVIVALPADKVLSAVNEAAELGVKGAVIITSGFKEAEYEEGKVLENKLREIAEKKSLRIIGPNTFGVVNIVKGINMSFTPIFNEVKNGRIALLSQSGGICHYVLHEFRDTGFSYIIHLGNRCDVDFPDVFEFLKNDPNTDVVAVYVEGVDNGRAFFEQIKRLAERKKVVVMKSGKSSVADKASLSHTGSMAGDYRVFTSAIKQAGGVVAETPIELMDVAIALERLEGLENAKGKGVAVLTIQAGLGIVAADIIETSGGRLAEFEEKTIKKLKELLPPITMRENPIDLSFSGLDVYKFTGVIDAISSDADTGIIMFLYAVAPPSWVIPPEAVGGIASRMKKPAIFVYSSTPENYSEVKKALEGRNVVLFNSVERAAKTAAVICQKRNNF